MNNSKPKNEVYKKNSSNVKNEVLQLNPCQAYNYSKPQPETVFLILTAIKKTKKRTQSNPLIKELFAHQSKSTLAV